MNTKVIIIIVAVIAILGVGLFVFTQNRTVNPPITPRVTQTSPVEANTVIIRNFSFEPAVLKVPVGTKVTWINHDQAPHTATSATFSTGNLNTGEKGSYTFTQKGTFDYYCSVHPSMTATIIVE